MNYQQICITLRNSLKSQMTVYIYMNSILLTALRKSLWPKVDAAIFTKQVPLTCALIFSTITMFPTGQSVSAQQTLYIGSKIFMPEVTVNLGAIYGSLNSSSKTNVSSRQLDHLPDYGNTRLLIPNLQTVNKTQIRKLRPPNTGGLLVSQAAPAPARRTAWQGTSVADARVVPTVMPLSSPIKGRDVSIAALPPLSQIPNRDQPAKSKLMSVLKKNPIDETKYARANKKPKLIRAANKSKTPSVPTQKRLTPPPPPPPPRTAVKAELGMLKLPTAAKLIAKKKEGASDNSAPGPKTNLGQIASLPPAGDKLLEVRFRSGSSVLTRKDEQSLIKMTQIIGPTAMRLQLKAFAEAIGNNSSKARRLSLSRALAVRSFLIENGLRSRRIDVRALGIARDGGATDRVDIVSLDQ